MNNNHYCVLDIETGGTDPKRCQVTQISAIIINPRNLKQEPNGIFDSEVCPIMDDLKAIENELDPLDDRALSVSNKSRETLALAPAEKIVWHKFTQFITKYNKGRSSYNAPIMCGFNINNFDRIIIDRLSTKYKTGDLFSPIFKIDLFDYFFLSTEADQRVEKRTLSAMMDWLGMPEHLKNGAHNSLVDVKNTANILIKILGWQRKINKENDYSKAFSDGQIYIQ